MCLFWGSNTHHLNTTEDNFEATNPYVQRSGGDSKNQEHKKYERSDSFLTMPVPAGSPSRGGDLAVDDFDINQTELAYSFSFRSCVCFCLYGPFNGISINKFFRRLSAFSLCSSCLFSALLVLSTIYLFTKISLSRDIILCG